MWLFMKKIKINLVSALDCLQKEEKKKQIQNILPTQRLIKAPGVELNVIEGPVFDTCTFVQKRVKKVQVSRFVFAFILHLLRTPSTESAK